MQVVDHRCLVLARARILVLQDGAGAAIEPGEKKRQVVLKVEHRLAAQLQRSDIHLIVAVELEAGDASVGRDVLILLAHRRSQPVDLDLAGQPSDVASLQRLLLKRTESLDQRGGERPRGAQPGTRWDVGEGGDLDLPRIRRHRAQRLAHDGVLHVVHTINMFQVRVLQEDPGGKRADNRNVDVLVDGGRDEGSPVIPIVRGQIGSPTPEGDAQWTSHDDHDRDTS